MDDIDVIASYRQALKAEGWSETTIKATLGTLKMADKHPIFELGIIDANRHEIRAWLADGTTRSGRPWATNTRVLYYTRLSGFFQWCLNEEHILFNPMAGMKSPKPDQKLPKPCSDEELHVIITKGSKPLRTAAVLAAWAGLRCCEIATLDRADITQQPCAPGCTGCAGCDQGWRRRMMIRHGKGGRERAIRCHQVIWDELADLPPGPVIESRGWPGSASLISCRAWHEMARLGLTGVSLHRLRHWYGTRCLTCPGSSTLHVRDALGHKSVTSTQGYAQVAGTDLDRVIGSLPDIRLGRPTE